ncbi:MAG: glycosyltransferase [Thermodesulfobacteriota bacterium]
MYPANTVSAKHRPAFWKNPKKLRVLFLSDAIASRNGVGSYYEDLVDHLSDHVEIAELMSPGVVSADDLHRLTLSLPGDETQRLYLPKIQPVWKRLRQIRPDAVVIPTPGPYGLYGFLMARYLGIPICSGYHTQYDKLTDLYWNSVSSGLSRLGMRGFNRMIFSGSDVVVGNSGEMIDGALRDGARRVKMIGTPIARPFLSAPFAPLHRDLSSVCYAGRLAQEKNVGEVLEAAERLPRIRFVFAGDGPLHGAVEAKAARMENVEYVGWVSRNRVRAVIDAADMLVLPSAVESFGTIALEAMARRRMVQVSHRCGILNWPDLAEGVYAKGASEHLADAVDRLYNIPFGERLAVTEKAHAAATDFNRLTVAQWVDLLEQIAKKNASAETGIRAAG